MQAAHEEGWCKMSLLDDFKENTHVFRGDEKRLDQVAFDTLVEERGLAFAQGYLKAVHEITAAVGDIMKKPMQGRFDMPQTPAIVYGKMNLLHKALYKFVQDNGLGIDSIRKPSTTHTTKSPGW